MQASGRSVLLGLVWLLCACGCTRSTGLRPRWQFETEYAQPAVAVTDGQRVYVPAEALFCLDARTGRLQWRVVPLGIIRTRPQVYGDRVLFQCGGLYCVDAASGRVRWEHWAAAWSDLPPQASAHCAVMAAGRAVYGVDWGSGRQHWRFVADRPLRHLLLCDGVLVAATDTHLLGIDPQRGTRRWRVPLPGGGVTFGRVDDVVVVATRDRLTVHDVQDGSCLWRQALSWPLLRLVETDIPCVLIPQGAISAFAPRTCTRLWQTPVIAGWPGGIAVHASHAYVRLSDAGQVAAVSLDDGRVGNPVSLPRGRMSATAAGLLIRENGNLLQAAGTRLSCYDLPSGSAGTE